MTGGDPVHAAGAVLWRPGAEGGTCEIAVVHRPRHRDWSLPKGKVDPGETRADAAVRELAEETGFAAVLERHLRTVRYPVGDDEKIVDFWSARAGEGRFTVDEETDELRWLGPADAADLLTYESDRGVLEDFCAHPPPLRRLLLVRHALAGRRTDWSGPDGARPLVPEGRVQAEEIATLLARFGVGALHAVDNVRCHQTLEPYARAHGLTITPAPELADEAVFADPDAALALLARLAAGTATAAVCAQGGGIPDLVRDLAEAATRAGLPVVTNRDLTEPPSRKGSVWVLSLDADGALVAGDYYRDATF